MENPLAAKLSMFADISLDDKAALNWLCDDVRVFQPKCDVIKEGDRPENVFLLVDGWAMRYKVLPNGRRQIMAYLIPGDLCDIHVFILKEMDHCIGLLSEARIAVIPKEKMLSVLDERPRLARALWWSSLVDDSVLREWLVNMGQRNAYDRIAHLLAEMWLRLSVVGRVDGNSMQLPLTQVDLADTMGLTAVHVNRVLQQLRQDGVIELASGTLRIPNIEKLMRVSAFEPNYLHLQPRVN
ncbi:Crp/Fnr family transcriptional regulator [Novosphingobium terrae]|uniref:Crp/Fnr family transcriptional regulator n=1 Tax=Novosphingobium terrae TaxID=2726189 RepID=UPI001980CC4B|nr:Crp/Fnr family transcriptional regulator [Novosphingobium terrae]